jgi:L-rhamnose mutarotase
MRYCLALDLRDDPAVFEEYDRHHRDVWPEVLAHLRGSGVVDMTIWRRRDRLVMLIETEPGFLIEDLAVGEEAPARVREWEALMGSLQRALPGAPSAQPVWQGMDEVFHLRDGAL